ncbi:MAG: hypothetical protein IPF79_15620 [Ignavibacteria bacterium]|nr:hypothetical protein [Ignavibacteria bacterium]
MRCIRRYRVWRFVQFLPFALVTLALRRSAESPSVPSQGCIPNRYKGLAIPLPLGFGNNVLECPFLDENTMWNGEHDANTSSGIKFALVGGLQYVLRIASTEIVPAVLYRYGLTASTDVNNTMLRAFDATIALRVPL